VRGLHTIYNERQTANNMMLHIIRKEGEEDERLSCSLCKMQLERQSHSWPFEAVSEVQRDSGLDVYQR